MAEGHSINKTLEPLLTNVDITNDYMFSTVMQDSSLCLELLKVLLPDIKIEKLKYIHFNEDGSEVEDNKLDSEIHSETQKTLSGYFGFRGVRLDAYMNDGKTIYNIEMQTTEDRALPQRCRLYQSHIDISQLQRGEDYDKLRPCYVIFICKYDPFGLGFYRYGFQNRCDERTDFLLGDGAYKLFFNTKGHIGNISPELSELLKYMNNPNAYPVNQSENALIYKIENAVNEVKTNSKWRDEFMIYHLKQREAELRGEQVGEARGEARGRAEGEARGRAEGEQIGEARGEARGRAEERKENVQNLLRAGVTEDLIAKAFNLPISEVNAIKTQLTN